MAGKLTIFYFCVQKASFIDKDVEILRSEFEVEVCAFLAREKWKTPLLFLTQLVFLLGRTWKWKNAVAISQFAGYHSFIPAIWSYLTGRKSIVVVGGTDCVAFPSLGYGHLRKGLLKWFCQKSYEWSTVVSAVHKCLFMREDTYYLESESKQGILHYFPKATFRQNVIPNGFDPARFFISTPILQRKPLSFCTISVSLDDPIRMKLKGVDMVLNLAKRLPEATFTFIGASEDADIEVPANVKLIGQVPNSALPGWYNQNQFYIQLSVSEGFPNALCEAICCGCVPIVSKVASMPDIVGNAGLIVPKRDPEMLFEMVRSFVQSVDLEQTSTNLSREITERFPLERRKNELLHLVKE